MVSLIHDVLIIFTFLLFLGNFIPRLNQELLKVIYRGQIVVKFLID